MILNFVVQKQLLENWCWAAVSSSVSYYYRQYQSGFNQAQIAASLIDSVCQGINEDNARNAPSQCNTPKGLSLALTVTGNYAGDLPRVLTFDEVVSQINSGFPVGCQINWATLSQSHFVTIYGYTGTSLVIGDPEAGLFYVEYSNFIFYRGGIWRRTIATKP